MFGDQLLCRASDHAPDSEFEIEHEHDSANPGYLVLISIVHTDQYCQLRLHRTSVHLIPLQSLCLSVPIWQPLSGI